MAGSGPGADCLLYGLAGSEQNVRPIILTAVAANAVVIREQSSRHRYLRLFHILKFGWCSGYMDRTRPSLLGHYCHRRDIQICFASAFPVNYRPSLLQTIGQAYPHASLVNAGYWKVYVRPSEHQWPSTVQSYLWRPALCCHSST